MSATADRVRYVALVWTPNGIASVDHLTVFPTGIRYAGLTYAPLRMRGGKMRVEYGPRSGAAIVHYKPGGIGSRPDEPPILDLPGAQVGLADGNGKHPHADRPREERRRGAESPAVEQLCRRHFGRERRRNAIQGR